MTSNRMTSDYGPPGAVMPSLVAGEGRRIRARAALAVLGGVYLALALFAPALAPQSTSTLGSAAPYLGIGSKYLLGTDELGRDLLSRLLVAARVGIFVGAASVALAMLAGGVLGLLGGYLGGVIDSTISRVVDFLFAFPEFLLGIIVIAALGPSMWHAALAIGIVYTPRFARLTRSEVLAVKATSYIEAAQIARRSPLSIIARHVIPNVTGPLVVFGALSMSTAQLTYAGLSFLGFGARPPTPDYGQMLADGTTHMLQDPLLVLAPAVALSLLVLGFTFFGDLLRDALDPRSGPGRQR